MNRLEEVMGQIARGRADGGRPLSGETARQMARDVMVELGRRWPPGNNATRAPAETFAALTGSGNPENGDYAAGLPPGWETGRT